MWVFHSVVCVCVGFFYYPCDPGLKHCRKKCSVVWYLGGTKCHKRGEVDCVCVSMCAVRQREGMEDERRRSTRWRGGGR